MANHPIPSTCDEIYRVASLPFYEANALLSRVDKTLLVRCFADRYPKFGYGYLHSTDHYAALKILNPSKEPSFLEVYDSYHIHGSHYIDKARELTAGLPTDRPEGWEHWTYDQKRLSALTRLYGISRGSRIYDGRFKDPNPDRAAQLLALWGLSTLPSDPPILRPSQLDLIREVLSPLRSIKSAPISALTRQYTDFSVPEDKKSGLRILVNYLEWIERFVERF